MLLRKDDERMVTSDDRKINPRPQMVANATINNDLVAYNGWFDPSSGSNEELMMALYDEICLLMEEESQTKLFSPSSGARKRFRAPLFKGRVIFLWVFSIGVIIIKLCLLIITSYGTIPLLAKGGD